MPNASLPSARQEAQICRRRRYAERICLQNGLVGSWEWIIAKQNWGQPRIELGASPTRRANHAN